MFDGEPRTIVSWPMVISGELGKEILLINEIKN